MSDLSARLTSAARVRLSRVATDVAERLDPDPYPELTRVTDADRSYVNTLHDESVPLPAGAEAALRSDNPRLSELRAAYAAVDTPVTAGSRWSDEHVKGFLDLRWFRGETLITWHYREIPRVTALKYFVHGKYVQERDSLGLLGRLDEDGQFGCWTHDYPGLGRVSRDLLDSVNELNFLERTFGLSSRSELRVLDIGAGYGRLAHRMSGAFSIRDYCCVDAVPESTFLCEYYVDHRGCAPPTRVVPLHELDRALEPGAFDLAVNIHSFPECTYAAVEWWLALLRRLRVPWLFVVPNDEDRLLSTERDGTRRDLSPLVEQAGYRLTHSERVIDDPAVRDLIRVDDCFHLYALNG